MEAASKMIGLVERPSNARKRRRNSYMSLRSEGKISCPRKSAPISPKKLADISSSALNGDFKR